MTDHHLSEIPAKEATCTNAGNSAYWTCDICDNYFSDADGKTIAGNMLSAYFSKGCDSRKLFAPYKISKDPSFETNLNKLNVIQIDMNSEFKNELDKENLLNNLQNKIVSEFIEQFPDIEFNPKESVGNCILKAHKRMSILSSSWTNTMCLSVRA